MAMTTLAELRTKIDDVDQRIIQLLSERAGYVDEIAHHKKTDNDVVATDRQNQVYTTRRQWAEAANLDPDFVENLYRLMIAHFIEVQRQKLQANEPASTTER